MRRITHTLLTTCLATALVSGCIHTRAERTTPVAVNEGLPLTTTHDGALTYEHLVYTEARLPLGEFFSRLASGEFTSAFSRINFAYEPATTDNEALARLMDAGLVPVYLRVTNHGTQPLPLRTDDFSLTDGNKSAKPYQADDLPRALSSFNSAAAGANVYNTGVIVVSVAAIVAVMVLASGASGPCCLGSAGGKDPVYNNTTMTTTILYKDYLFPTGPLAPGATAKGLLFFKAPEGADDLRLQLALGRAK